MRCCSDSTSCSTNFFFSDPTNREKFSCSKDVVSRLRFCGYACLASTRLVTANHVYQPSTNPCQAPQPMPLRPLQFQPSDRLRTA